MRKVQNILGNRYGRLVVVEHLGRRGNETAHMWKCLCDCGGTHSVRTGDLTWGKIVSCGCRHKENAAGRFRTHGKSKTSTYYTWQDMWRRCSDARRADYKHYGGRGITVCARWQKFENFLEDMGERPEDLTLDRVDTNGDYVLGNCRWATSEVQARNRRPVLRSTLTGHKGVTITREGTYLAHIGYNKRTWFGIRRKAIEEAIADRARMEEFFWGEER